MRARAAGQRALGHIDHVRAKRPEPDTHELSAALGCLAECRDSIVTRHRARPDAVGIVQLEQLNAVISTVLGVQFPLGEVPWAELDQARGWLSALLDGADAYFSPEP